MLLKNHSLTLPFPPKSLHRNCNISRNISASAAPLEFLQSVLSATSVLAAIVIVLKSGHFLAASLRGIRVSKFSLSFGPVVTRFVIPSTDIEFSFCTLPLGDFVAFLDVSDPDFLDLSIPSNNLLRNRPLPDRILVISVGIAANLFFAYSLLFAQVLSVSFPVQSPLPRILIPEVKPNSAAASAGLHPFRPRGARFTMLSRAGTQRS